MHWSDFRGGDERTLCPIQPPDGSRRKARRRRRGPGRPARGRGHRGPLCRRARCRSCTRRRAGRSWRSFVVDAEGLIRSSPYRPPDYPYEQVGFQTRETVVRALLTPGRARPGIDSGASPSRAACLFPSTGPTSSTPSAAPRSSVIGPPFCGAMRRRCLRMSRPRSSSRRSRAPLASFPAKKTPRPRSSDRCAFAVTPPTPIRACGERGSTPKRSKPIASRRRHSRSKDGCRCPERSPELMPPLAGRRAAALGDRADRTLPSRPLHGAGRLRVSRPC